MTLLSVVQNVADAVGLPRPSQVAGNAQQLARQMLSLANKTIQDVSKRNWPQLTQPYSFNTVPGQEEYALPGDWASMIPDTVFADGTWRAVRGSHTAMSWAEAKSMLAVPVGAYRIRISGSPLKFHLNPAPSTVEPITLWYVTKYRVTTATGSGEAYANDTDVCKIPEEVIELGLQWRIKHAKGLDYSEDFNDFDRQCNEYLAKSLALGSLAVSARMAYGDFDMPSPYMPETGFGI